MQGAHQGFCNVGRLRLKGTCCPSPGSALGRWDGALVPLVPAAVGCSVPPEGVTAMTTTSPQARPAAATPLTFAADPGGRFPSVLTEDDSRVTAPSGGEPMRVIHRYEDLLSVKSSPAWRMANRCETPLTGAEIPGGDPPGHLLGMDGAPHRKLRRTIGHLFTSAAADAQRPRMRKTAGVLLDRLAVGGTGGLRADYAEPATAA